MTNSRLWHRLDLPSTLLVAAIAIVATVGFYNFTLSRKMYLDAVIWSFAWVGMLSLHVAAVIHNPEVQSPWPSRFLRFAGVCLGLLIAFGVYYEVVGAIK